MSNRNVCTDKVQLRLIAQQPSPRSDDIGVRSDATREMVLRHFGPRRKTLVRDGLGSCVRLLDLSMQILHAREQRLPVLDVGERSSPQCTYEQHNRSPVPLVRLHTIPESGECRPIGAFELAQCAFQPRVSGVVRAQVVSASSHESVSRCTRDGWCHQVFRHEPHEGRNWTAVWLSLAHDGRELPEVDLRNDMLGFFLSHAG